MKKLEDINFPQYRKYKNGRHLFKILSPTELEELQWMGSKVLYSLKTASILPDKYLILDLCFDYEAFAEVCPAEEFEALKEKATPF